MLRFEVFLIFSPKRALLPFGEVKVSRDGPESGCHQGKGITLPNVHIHDAFSTH